MFIRKIISLAYRLQFLCPLRLKLSYLAWINKNTGGETEVSHLKQIGPCRGLAVDIGANYGFYTLALSKLYSRVIAFEPNVRITAPLFYAKLPGVTISHTGLSSKMGSAIFYTPISRGVMLEGWASLNSSNCPDATELVQQEIQLNTLDSFELKGVGFIKIDVEGHELEVLNGSAKTIQRDLPHLLIEIKQEHLHEARTLLSSWGYFEVPMVSLSGSVGSPENYIFLPFCYVNSSASE